MRCIIYNSILPSFGGTAQGRCEENLQGGTNFSKGRRRLSGPPVAEGESVSAGQIIGAVGSGAAAESDRGPHLHFRVTLDGDAVDPQTFLEG